MVEKQQQQREGCLSLLSVLKQETSISCVCLNMVLMLIGSGTKISYCDDKHPDYSSKKKGGGRGGGG